jgi:hypothetical protein
MIIEYLRYTNPAERQDEFIRDYTCAKEPLLRSPYAVPLTCASVSRIPTQFILRIEWTSTEDHLKRFRGNGEFKEFLGLIRPYPQNIDEMRHYEPR